MINKRLLDLVMRAKLDLEEVAQELSAASPRDIVVDVDEDLPEIRARLDALESRVRVIEGMRDGQAD